MNHAGSSTNVTFLATVATLIVAIGLWFAGDAVASVKLGSVVATIAISCLVFAIMKRQPVNSSGAVLDHLVQNDPAIALLTTQNGDILALNARAVERLDAKTGQSLSIALAAIVATPESVLFDYLKRRWFMAMRQKCL